MRVSTDDFLHNDKLFIVDARPAGSPPSYETASWDPAGVIAQARAVSGSAANPFERFKLALIAEAVSLCGGCQSAGIALLELSLFTFLTVRRRGPLGMSGGRAVLWASEKLSGA